MKLKRSEQIALNKMLDYCSNIETLMARFGPDFDTYREDIAYQYSIGMCILQIGELVSRLSDELQKDTAYIPWRAIRGMRNIYAHNYEATKLETMWQTITEDIPTLKSQLRDILEHSVIE